MRLTLTWRKKWNLLHPLSQTGPRPPSHLPRLPTSASTGAFLPFPRLSALGHSCTPLPSPRSITVPAPAARPIPVPFPHPARPSCPLLPQPPAHLHTGVKKQDGVLGGDAPLTFPTNCERGLATGSLPFVIGRAAALRGKPSKQMVPLAIIYHLGADRRVSQECTPLTNRAAHRPLRTPDCRCSLPVSSSSSPSRRQACWFALGGEGRLLTVRVARPVCARWPDRHTTSRTWHVGGRSAKFKHKHGHDISAPTVIYPHSAYGNPGLRL